MRILILTRFYFPIDRPSGVISLIREYAYSLLKKDHDVAVACIKQSGELFQYIDDSNIRVFKFKQTSPLSLLKIKKIFKPDKVIVFSSISSGVIILLWWWLLLRCSGLLRVCTFYQTTNCKLSKIQKTLFIKVVSLFEKFIVTNSYLNDYFHLNEELSSVVLPGVNINEYERYDLVRTIDTFKICYMGHLTEVKGADKIIDLATSLSSFKFKIIAGISPGKKNIAFSTQLLKRANELNNVDYIRFCKDPIAQLSECDLLILPYRSGDTVLGVAQSAIEAMCLGIPVLATPNSAVIDIVHHGENGFLFETLDEMEQCVLNLERDPLLYEKLSGNARATVKDKFNIEDKIHQLINI